MSIILKKLWDGSLVAVGVANNGHKLPSFRFVGSPLCDSVVLVQASPFSYILVL